jgi:hypothetical protein
MRRPDVKAKGMKAEEVRHNKQTKRRKANENNLSIVNERLTKVYQYYHNKSIEWSDDLRCAKDWL